MGAPVRTRGSRVTWRWRLDQPVPAYLLSVQIGRYRLVDAAPPAEGLPPLRVAMWVGDNIRDFPALSQTARRGDFGGRFWVLPNPMYGSWDRNPDPLDTP